MSQPKDKPNKNERETQPNPDKEINRPKEKANQILIEKMNQPKEKTNQILIEKKNQLKGKTNQILIEIE